MEEKHGAHVIVTIARVMGSGGSFIGKRLAQRLGCRYLDREILLEAARRLRRDPEALEAFDERHLTFWERTRMAYAFGAPDSPYAPPPVTVDDKDLFDVQKTIIQEASERGPATIVGRGGFALLKGLPGHLSVFLHAPLDLRARRIRRLYSLGSLEEARDMAEQSDRERGHFVKAVVGANWLDPNQYHICLDTGRLGTGAATELLYQAALEVARSVRNKEEPELL